MYWEDSGFLLSKNRFNENSVIAEIFTENHGKVTGIIFGATSKKIKSYLQIGNNFHLNYNTKVDGRIGSLKVEINHALTPLYFENKKKLACIISAMDLIKLLTVEFQENKNLYNLINIFFESLKKPNWLKEFVLWELEFLKIIGYDLELNKLVNEEIINGKKIYVVKSNKEKKLVPNFLIDFEDDNLDNKNILSGFKLVEDYLNKSILKPNNISLPNSRIDFINLIKL